MKQRIYYCIDMKSFFASVECAERGLNPFDTNLVVADETRGKGGICLAITPKMKAMGIPNRCRLYEIPDCVDYIIAKPRMKKYIEYAADIYSIYLKYISKDDIHVYSIDESFIDATDYLKCYKTNAKDFAMMLTNEIATTLSIPATVGIGTNLYLAKIALDITAKHTPDHMGYLDEKTYIDTLWRHRPITDFWQIAKGTAERLRRYGIFDMKGVAEANEDFLYRQFGVNAELLIDHAWGRESCTMADIKAYKSKSKSISNSQVLFRDYGYAEARLVLTEMVSSLCQQMLRDKVITGRVSVSVSYSKGVIPPTGASQKMRETTNAFSIVKGYILSLYDKTTMRDVSIRRLGISFGDIVDQSCEGYDLFTDYEALDKERRGQLAVIGIQDKFGKNAILRGIDLEEGATARIRNKLVGGHNGE